MVDKIIIPSLGRYEGMNATNNMVEKLKETEEIEWFFAIKKNEFEGYKKLVGEEHIIILPDYIKGYNATVKYLILNSGDRFFLLDDDIFVILERRDWNKEKKYWRMKKLDDWINMFKEFDKYENNVQTSLSLKQVGWIYKEDFIVNKRCCAFVHYNYDVFKKGDKEKFFDALDKFDTKKYKLYLDNYITAVLLSMGYNTLIINNYNFGCPTSSTTKGGCEYDFSENNQQSGSAKYIASFFPEFSKIIKNKGRIEVKLNWKKIYEKSQRKNSSLYNFL